MPGWTEKAATHALQHRMEDSLFVSGPCAYCGLTTVDFCPECGVFVCRRCDRRDHWPAVGIIPDVGFAVGESLSFGRYDRPRRLR